MFYDIYRICLQYSDYFYIFVRFIFYDKYWNTFASHCVLETCSFHSPFSSSSDIYIYIGISLAPFLYTSSRNFSLKLLHYIYMCTRLLHRLICRPFFFHFFTFNPTRETVYKSLRLCFYFIHSRRREKGH